MAAQNAITTSHAGLTPSVFYPSVTRELHMTAAQTGITSSAFRPGLIRGASTFSVQYVYPPGQYQNVGASLGISSSSFTPVFLRAINTFATHYVYPPGIYVTNGSLGLSANVDAGIGHSVNAVASINLDALLFLPTFVWARKATGSLGLSGKSGAIFHRSASAQGSVGTSGYSHISRLYVVKATGSVGITALYSPDFKYVRGYAYGMLGLSSVGAPNLRRSAVSIVSLGLSGSVNVNITPFSVPPNGIYLFEATDAHSPTTLAAILARDYQRLYLDQTVSSYPQPFALLN